MFLGGHIIMKRILIFTVLAAFMFMGCGTALNVVKGSGNMKTKEITFNAFHGIVAGNAFDVEVVEGDDYAVYLEYDDNLDAYLDVYQDNGKVTLRLDDMKLYNNVTLKAKVVMKDINYIRASGASQVKIADDMTYANRLSVKLSGASNLDAMMETEELTIDLSGASNIEGELFAKEVTSDLSGASSVTLEGQVRDFTVKASGASNVEIGVSDTLSVDASGASSVRVYGQPSIEHSDLSGASSLETDL